MGHDLFAFKKKQMIHLINFVKYSANKLEPNNKIFTEICNEYKTDEIFILNINL
jgi:hypothetical protein